MSEQEPKPSSFHLKNGTGTTGRLPVSEQYLYDKQIQDQTEQLKKQAESAEISEPSDISTEGLSDTAILRLKAEQTSVNKSNGISGASHSITAAYQDAVREQQASLSKQRKNRHTIGIVKKTIMIVIIAAVLVTGAVFVSGHLNKLDKIKPKESKSTKEVLCDSKWTTDSIGSFTFTNDNKVIRKNGSTETGTYELTDQNVLIMHFKNEELSYMIETDTDGIVKWVHSYNGFEEVITPNTIPVSQ